MKAELCVRMEYYSLLSYASFPLALLQLPHSTLPGITPLYSRVIVFPQKQRDGRSAVGWHLLAMGGIQPPPLDTPGCPAPCAMFHNFVIEIKLQFFQNKTINKIFFIVFFVIFLRLQEMTRSERNAENMTRKTADFCRKLLASQLEESRWPRRCMVS